jgi:hypothetical protein
LFRCHGTGLPPKIGNIEFCDSWYFSPTRYGRQSSDKTVTKNSSYCKKIDS